MEVVGYDGREVFGVARGYADYAGGGGLVKITADTGDMATGRVCKTPLLGLRFWDFGE